MTDRVVVVVKRTAYRLFVEEEQDERIARLLKKNDPTVRKMRRSHDEHEGTIEEVDRALRKIGADAVWVRRAHAPFDVDEADLVVTVGGDGTLLAASHRVGTTPILGVNSAPAHSVGFFCGVKKGHVRAALEQALRRQDESGPARAHGGHPQRRAAVHPRAQRRALLPPRRRPRPRATSCSSGSVVEEQKSSGFWIGPAAGSTAAQRSARGQDRCLLASTDLQLVVREPYTPEGEKLKLVRELVSKKGEVFVRSKTREGRLFIDGPHEVVEIEMGDRLVFRQSSESLTVLGLSARRRWGVVPAKS